jgi:hypothetical protein
MAEAPQCDPLLPFSMDLVGGAQLAKSIDAHHWKRL